MRVNIYLGEFNLCPITAFATIGVTILLSCFLYYFLYWYQELIFQSWLVIVTVEIAISCILSFTISLRENPYPVMALLFHIFKTLIYGFCTAFLQMTPTDLVPNKEVLCSLGTILLVPHRYIRVVWDPCVRQWCTIYYSNMSSN